MKDLETKNLYLRKFTKEDAEDIYMEIKNSKELATNSDFIIHGNIEVTKAIIECAVNSVDERFSWAMVLKNSNKTIGYIKIKHISFEDEFCRFVCAIIPEYNKKEYSIETLEEVMRYLEKEKNIKTFEIQMYSDNDHIAKPILEEIGFIREAVLKNRRYNEKEKRFEDLIIYTLLK